MLLRADRLAAAWPNVLESSSRRLGWFEVWIGNSPGDTDDANGAHFCGGGVAQNEHNPFWFDCDGGPSDGRYITVKQTICDGGNCMLSVW